jgi:hypothetical protein
MLSTIVTGLTSGQVMNHIDAMWEGIRLFTEPRYKKIK